ncbi:IclR family transcriptional regulator C-terminal domain-containing protein [Pseudomonas moorei]|uniref:IclR family transcriptional regulator n=1 Tax=Pseudomonas moorei TaxID=395599 RepID=UPI0036F2E720
MTISSSDRSPIQVITRAAAILRCLESEPNGLSLGAIAKRIELPRSTVQRLVDALVVEQLLELQGAGGVRLGPALMRLASHSHVDITQHARPFLEQLAQTTGETAVLETANGDNLLILHSVVSHQALRVSPVAGSMFNIYATSGGKILLSKLDDEAVIKLVGHTLQPLTPKTPTLSELLAQLKLVREEGFAYDFDEHTIGVGAVAVGLQTPQGSYSIDVVGPVWRLQEDLPGIKEALMNCQSGLNKALRGLD